MFDSATADAVEAARALAWRALNKRDRTVDEVGGMLLGKRVEPAVADQVGTELIERGRDQRRIHSQREEPALDPLGAPGVDRAPVLGEALGVAGVVQVPEMVQLVDRAADDRRIDPLGAQALSHLGHRAVAVAEEAVGQVQRVLQAIAVGHAACSIGAGGASASSTVTSAGITASGSIGWTRSRSMPSAP